VSREFLDRMLAHPTESQSPPRHPPRMAERSLPERVLQRAVPVALVASVLAAGLGSPSGGTHPDERLYLSLANEMQVQGTWMTPTLEGQPDYTKPPLLYWAARACLGIFGPRLWAARLPVAICALLLALVAGRLARRFGGEPAFARGVLLVGTSLGVLRYGRLTMMDVPLALAVALAVDVVWTAVERRRPALLLQMGLAAGLSGLLKGPVGPLLVLGIGAGILAMYVGFIELFLEFVKPVTLSMRLFGNIYGGEVALAVITALTLAVVPVALIGLEALLNLIQALIFSVLTLMFILIAIEGHGSEEHKPAGAGAHTNDSTAPGGAENHQPAAA